MRSGGQCCVKGYIQRSKALAIGACGFVFGEHGLESRQVVGCVALGGKARNLNLQQPPHFQHLVVLIAVVFGLDEEAQRVTETGHGRRAHGDATACAIAHLNQSASAEARERFAHHRAAHAKLPAEFTLGGQLIAIAQHTVQNLLLNLRGHQAHERRAACHRTYAGQGVDISARWWFHCRSVVSEASLSRAATWRKAR